MHLSVARIPFAQHPQIGSSQGRLESSPDHLSARAARPIKRESPPLRGWSRALCPTSFLGSGHKAGYPMSDSLTDPPKSEGEGTTARDIAASPPLDPYSVSARPGTGRATPNIPLAREVHIDHPWDRLTRPRCCVQHRHPRVLGVILVILGVIFWILGAMGRAVGGRRHYY